MRPTTPTRLLEVIRQNLAFPVRIERDVIRAPHSVDPICSLDDPASVVI